MKIEIDFSVRGDVKKVERSTMRAYILKELRRRNNTLFNEILQWKGKSFPISISWKEREFDTHDGHSATFWISARVSEDHDLSNAFALILKIKQIIKNGLGKEAVKYKEEIEKILKEYKKHSSRGRGR